MIFPFKPRPYSLSTPSFRGTSAVSGLFALCLSLSASAATAQRMTPPGPAPQTDVTSSDLTLGSNTLPDAPTPTLPAKSIPEPPQPLSTQGKFIYASKNAFGVPSLLFSAVGAASNQAQNLYPDFHQDMGGYGRYYWHSYADQAMDSYIVDFAMASVLHIDPRYQPLGSGGAARRTRHAVASMIFAQSDSGQRTFNTPQLLGSGISASLSSLYYPERDRTVSLVTQRWAGNLAGDALVKVLREFKPEFTRLGHSLCSGLSVCALLRKGEHTNDPW